MELCFLNYIFLALILKFHHFAFPKQMPVKDGGGGLDVKGHKGRLAGEQLLPLAVVCAGRRVTWAKLGLKSRDAILTTYHVYCQAPPPW